MNPSINPSGFATSQITTPAQQKTFLYQLSTLLQQIVSVITGIQNNVSTIQTSLSPNINILGSLAVNTAVNTNSSLHVLVVLTITAAVTLTLNNLANGAVVVIQPTVSGGTARTLKLAATNPSGTAYTTINLTYAGTGTLINMISTGQNITSGVSVTYAGIAGASGLELNLVGS